MLFHIGSTGRSGSVFAYQMLLQMGIPTIHEKESERPFSDRKLKWVQTNPDVFHMYKGTIGWRWDLLFPKLVAEAEHKFYMVRDPVEFIKSAVTHVDGLFDQVEERLGTKYVRAARNRQAYKVTRAANYWLSYFENFSPGRKILQVETFKHGGAALEEFCNTVGIPTAVTELARPKKERINSRLRNKEYSANAVDVLLDVAPDIYDLFMQKRAVVGYR
jgi:hypothetical protein